MTRGKRANVWITGFHKIWTIPWMNHFFSDHNLVTLIFVQAKCLQSSTISSCVVIFATHSQQHWAEGDWQASGLSLLTSWPLLQSGFHAVLEDLQAISQQYIKYEVQGQTHRYVQYVTSVVLLVVRKNKADLKWSVVLYEWWRLNTG